jgi:hypothetical protein
MVRCVRRRAGWILGALSLVCAIAAAQHQPNADKLTESGQTVVAGRSTPYRISHLPVNSFPELPQEIQEQLNQRGCLIPQTYQAHHPENVVHASLERPGSSDWAVLCSAQGTVSLLVFLASAPAHPSVLASAPGTQRLQAHDPAGVLGFNWGIDPASPERVRDAQASMEPRPPLLDHDALADSIVDHRTVYHFYAKGVWMLVEMPD